MKDDFSNTIPVKPIPDQGSNMSSEETTMTF